MNLSFSKLVESEDLNAYFHSREGKFLVLFHATDRILGYSVPYYFSDTIRENTAFN